MRGTYTATYLDRVASTFAKRRDLEALDIGAAFDLIVGTSTGGIIACALAKGVPLSDVVTLYQEHARKSLRSRYRLTYSPSRSLSLRAPQPWPRARTSCARLSRIISGQPRWATSMRGVPLHLPFPLSN